jgi:uncharacterized membrane protein
MEIAKPALSSAASARQHKAAWGTMLVGTALSLYGWTRKSASGAALGLAGGAIALKAASAGPIADLIGAETTISQSVMIMRSAEEIYVSCSDEKMGQWMRHGRTVSRIGNRRTLWNISLPGAGTLNWTLEVVGGIPNCELAWRLLSDGDANHIGKLRARFTQLPDRRGTRVTWSISHRVQRGLLHSGIEPLLGDDPKWELRESLRRFKMMMEAGEIATTEGQSHGPRSLKGKWTEKLLREVEQEAA